MSKKYHFKLPGITCTNCVIGLEQELNNKNINGLVIESHSIDVIARQILITVADNVFSTATVSQKLKDIIEGVGIECEEFVLPQQSVIELETIANADADTELEPLLNRVKTPAQENAEQKKQSNAFISHLLRGIFGLLYGFGLMIIMGVGFGIPAGVMYAILAISALSTVLLGLESYIDAGKKFIKSRTLTMDALFTISTVTVIGISIAHFFVPSLPMMMEAGLLIFGFRHIGKAIEESINQKVLSGLTFKDRAPKTIERRSAHDLEHGWSECPTHLLRANDIIRIKRGQYVPVDGTSRIDTLIYKTILTGEPVATKIKRGELVLAGMKVPIDLPEDMPELELDVTHPPADSHLARVDQEILEANREKAPLATMANKILQYFVPGVLVTAIVTGALVDVYFGHSLAIQWGTTLLVSACPCTLGLITPLALKINQAKGLENGVHFKSNKTLQLTADIKRVILDLNGTLTTGIPRVTDHQVCARNLLSPQKCLNYLMLIESKSQRPFARAICTYLNDKAQLDLELEIQEVDQSHHSGIKAVVNNEPCYVGNIDFMQKHGINVSSLEIEHNPTEHIVYFAKGRSVACYVKIQDPLRHDAKKMVTAIQNMGKEVFICTGADRNIALAYAKELGIPANRVFANCVGADISRHDPQARTKASIIKTLQVNSSVSMVGDAANDAAAIAQSDAGIAIESISGDPIAQEQAAAVIHRASLLPIATAFAVAKETVATIKQNLLASLGYNALFFVISGGLLIYKHWAISPGIGVAFMVSQTSLILLNQYRLSRRSFPHLQERANLQREREAGQANQSYQFFRRSGLLDLAPDPEIIYSAPELPSLLATYAQPLALDIRTGEVELPSLRGGHTPATSCKIQFDM